MNHLLQLYSFSEYTIKECEFHNNYEQFVQLVNTIQPMRATKLYDTMSDAIDSLIQIKKLYPNIVLRIIALTDGEDNFSKKTNPMH